MICCGNKRRVFPLREDAFVEIGFLRIFNSKVFCKIALQEIRNENRSTVYVRQVVRINAKSFVFPMKRHVVTNSLFVAHGKCNLEHVSSRRTDIRGNKNATAVPSWMIAGKMVFIVKLTDNT